LGKFIQLNSFILKLHVLLSNVGDSHVSEVPPAEGARDEEEDAQKLKDFGCHDLV